MGQPATPVDVAGRPRAWAAAGRLTDFCKTLPQRPLAVTLSTTVLPTASRLGPLTAMLVLTGRTALLCQRACIVALGSAPGASGSSQRSEGSERFVNASFLVFAQDYVPESVQVRFPVPSSADSILQMVGSARAPHFRDRFPVLKPVCPQPWSRIGTLVAMPPWPLRGVAVVFDLCRINSRCFSLVVPPVVDCAALLHAAVGGA